MNADIDNLNRKLDALCTILASPVWPKPAFLCPLGKSLYDAILADAKPLALAVVDGQDERVFEIASRWTVLLNAFIDGVLINAVDPDVANANKSLLAVYKHYLDATKISWGAVR